MRKHSKKGISTAGRNKRALTVASGNESVIPNHLAQDGPRNGIRYASTISTAHKLLWS